MTTDQLFKLKWAAMKTGRHNFAVFSVIRYTGPKWILDKFLLWSGFPDEKVQGRVALVTLRLT